MAKTESHNIHNRYTITALKLLPGTIRLSVVCCLPREISRFTYDIIIHGARVSCQVTDIHHRRSPLVQGGLEIPIQVTVTMDLGEGNVKVMKKYEDLVNEHYKEPVNGTFDDVTTSVLEALLSEDEDDDGSDTESGAEPDEHEAEAVEGSSIELDSD